MSTAVPSPRRPARPIRHFMSPSPHSVGRDQTLEVAHSMMRTHAVRHLPVLEAGKLVGLVSQRDLYLVETLRDVDPAVVRVEDAMSQDVYCVQPDDVLEDVAETMADQKFGCAVVMDHQKVVGLFTTTDALRALVALARKKER